jgi:membrane protein YdbS with pleckstrin-like domain
MSAAFEKDPQNVTFETQGNDEKIILLMRKHPFTNITWITMGVLLLLLPPVLLGSFFSFNIVDYFFLSPMTIVALLLAWYLFVLGYLFEHFMVWYFNLYILTTDRVVDIDFYHLLYKSIAAADLSDVQDVTFRMGGIAQAVFNYGDIHIQTAGSNVEFEFHSLPQPAAVQKAILDTAKGAN